MGPGNRGQSAEKNKYPDLNGLMIKYLTACMFDELREVNTLQI